MSAALAAQQQALLQALWQPRHDDAIAALTARGHLVHAGGRDRWARGIQAYRSNGHALAQRVLAAAYPVVAELMGAENFEALARQAWQNDPPVRGDMAQWGVAFPALIESLPDLAREEPYLADVARVEWALHCAATVADMQADTASFSLLAQGDPSRVTIVLAGVASIASAFPVASIVRAHVEGEPTLEEAGQRLRARVAETALIWRDGMKPRVRPAWPAEAAFIAALREGGSLSDAIEAAPDFDFSAWLTPAVQTGLVLGACTI